MREINWRELSIRDYLHMLNRRKWALIIPFVLVVGSAVPLMRYMTPVYQASTTLVAEEVSRGNVLRGVAQIPVPPGEGFELVQQRMMSRRLLMQVADKLKLREYLQGKQRGEIADTGFVSFLRKKWVTLLEKLKLKKPREEITDEDIVRYLRDCISLKRRSRVIEIRVLNSNPKLTM
ncbi:hypothetical protein DRN32_01905, partial [Thermococci archaeon]